MTIEELKTRKEPEDKIEFKEAKHNFSFAGSEYTLQEERRKCFLGYMAAGDDCRSFSKALGLDTY